jgi:ribosomal protein S12 methylthiotransferase
MSLDSARPELKLGVISLGCDKATVDSERLVGSLLGNGTTFVKDLESADVVLVNTCGFIDAAKQESIEAMLEAGELKRRGSIKAVVAVGCLVQRYKEKLQKEIPEVDLFLNFGELGRLAPELAARGLLTSSSAAHPGVRQYLGDGPHVRYLKISEGCDHTCAFCAIPLMRGKHRSESLERLVAEAQSLEASGAKEVNLVAQDLGHWGRDYGRNGPKLPGPSRGSVCCMCIPQVSTIGWSTSCHLARASFRTSTSPSSTLPTAC